MYDLLQKWSELEQLKQNKWQIDSIYDSSEDKFTFKLKRYCRDGEDEIFSIEVVFRQLYLKWYCYVFIEQFFASSSLDFTIGFEALEIIQNKINEIKAIMDDKEIPEAIGRC